MTVLEVKMVELPALHVASALGFGEGPEDIAWGKVFDFLKRRDLLKSVENLAFYGFNNPNPTPASPNYGYEQWVVVPETITEDEALEIKTFDGGWYAVTRCVGIPNIYAAWKKLYAWREDSPYLPASHQWLEKWVDPSLELPDADHLILDLYLPILKP
jgi:DNA gyrase inhibitor GyrI